jgi:serine phosphatase RsbU (regulator of sigma subunit)
MIELKLQNEYERKVLSDSLKVAEEKKVSELKLSEEKTKRNYLYAGIFLLVIVVGLVSNRFRITQKQKRIIEKQKKEVENQKHMVDEKQKEILDSINYAKRIQNAIIPSKATLAKNLQNHFLFYKPKDIVAGDFYWFQTVNDLKLVAVADCTGHGVPGALVSVVCSNALNAAVKEFGLSTPAGILNKTREIVLEAFAMSEETINDGMDISLCAIRKLDGDNYEVQWAGANNSLWYVKNNEFFEIKANKFPIGRAYISGEFTNHTIHLSKNDYLVLYSDGFADQFGGDKGKKYKYKNLVSFIRQAEASGTAFGDLSDSLEQEFEKWKGKNAQIDDVCVLGIKL